MVNMVRAMLNPLLRHCHDLEDEIGRLALSDSLYKGNATSLNQMRRLIRLYDRYQDNLLYSYVSGRQLNCNV